MATKKSHRLVLKPTTVAHNHIGQGQIYLYCTFQTADAAQSA